MGRFRRLGQLLAAGTVTATVVTGIPAVASASDEVTFSVTNFTDFHGHLLPSSELKPGKEMGAAKLAALVKHVNENQDYILTSAGDNVGGSAFISAIDNDTPTLEALNAMDLKVTAVGNHEFDKGQDDLLGRISEASNYPILGANVYKDGERLLPATDVQEIQGVKVGFVGTVTTLTQSKVAPDKIEGIEFRDPVAETNAEAKRLKESGEADVVVALMHEDVNQYVNGFDDAVDVVFGGDSHQEASGSIPRADKPDMVYAQGHEYGKVLNDVDLTYDKTAGELTSSELTLYDAGEAAQLDDDPEVAAIVDKAKATADEKGKQVVGKLEAPLLRGSAPGKDSGSHRGTESTGNNFIAEANRDILSKQTGREIQIGIMNAGGVRDDLQAGDVTYEQAATVQPFNNDISVGNLSGTDIINLLEQQWKTEGERARLSLGLSDGFTYTYDPTAPQGERVISASLGGEPIDPKATYSVAASSFLFAGGDSFSAFENAADVVNVGANDLAVYAEYIGDENHKYPYTQHDIAIDVEGDLQPGKKATLNLASLNYTTEGEPQAENVTVKLGEETATAAINNEPAEGDDQGNEHGRAKVEITVPANLPDDAVLEITTDVETGAEHTMIVPVAALGVATDDAGDDAGQTDGDGDNAGQSHGNGESNSAGDSDGDNAGDSDAAGNDHDEKAPNGSAALPGLSADVALIGGSAALAAIAAPMVADFTTPWGEKVRDVLHF